MQVNVSSSQSARADAAGEVAARHAFLDQAHASFDASLRGFFAKRGIRRHEIADFTQEVYLRLARRPDLKTIRSAQAFVFATALNLLRDRFRRQASRGVPRRLEDSDIEVEADGHDPQRSAECDQELTAVWQVMSSLKPVTQRVFLEHRMQGRSYAELARELGVSISMIEKHMICAIGALSPLRGQPAR